MRTIRREWRRWAPGLAAATLSVLTGCATLVDRTLDTSFELLRIQQNLALDAAKAGSRLVARTAIDMGQVVVREAARPRRR